MAARTKVTVAPAEEATTEEVVSPLLNDTAEPDEGAEQLDDYVPIEDLDPNDELFPGGPTIGTIQEWKQEFGEDSVFVTSLSPTKHVVWRTLNRFEYRRLVKQLEQAMAGGTMTQAEANMNNEEQIAELCILFPSMNRAQMAGEQAGLASIISQEVMEASGFVPMEVRQL